MCTGRNLPATALAACSACPAGKWSPGKGAALPSCTTIAHRRRYSSATFPVRRRYTESNCFNVLAPGACRYEIWYGATADALAYIADVGGAMQCFACPAGRFAAAAGAGSCAVCPAGKWAAGVDMLTAAEAAAGATSCATCPEVTITLREGATSADECVAAPCGIRYTLEGKTNAGPCPFATPPAQLPATPANEIARHAYAPCCYQNACSKLLCDVDPSAENTGTPALASLRPSVLPADGSAALELVGSSLSKFTEYTCVFAATDGSGYVLLGVRVRRRDARRQARARGARGRHTAAR